MRYNLSSMLHGLLAYPWFMGEQKGWPGHEEVAMSFQARIKAAMTRKGWTAEPMVLMGKWEEKFGAKKTPRRQTFYAWFKATPPRIEPEKLFDLGDLLEVNPAWLSLKSDDMTRPITPGDDLQEFLDAYRHLAEKNAAAKDELIEDVNREARKALRIHSAGTVANPLKKETTG